MGTRISSKGSWALRARLLLLAMAGLGLGCGQRFDLPPQPEPGRIPNPGRYNFETIWEVASPTDLVSQGSYLYVIEEESRVAAYLTNSKSPRHPPFVGEFLGLIRPVQICLARRDSTYIVVADAGDMTIKRYLFTGGAPRFTFQDSIWTEFSGLAADSRLNVYVADASKDSILQYDAEGRRARLVSDRGTGTGFVIGPHGLHWNGTHLVVADTEKNWVQRLLADTTNVAAPGLPIGSSVELSAPRDVSADREGEFIFVADTGKDRVLKFLTTGDLVDSVYSAAELDPRLVDPVLSPRFLAIQDALVFISDPLNGRIVAFKLASQ